jgi:hypothetical protein
VITNPGYKSGSEGSIPYPLTIPIPKSDIQRINRSEQLWLEQVYPRLLVRSPIGDVNQLDEAIDLRERIAQQLLTTGEHSVSTLNQVDSKEIELVSPHSNEVW